MSDAEAARRAGGRRQYNNWRASLAMRRRGEMVKLIDKYGFLDGAQATIAATIGVSPSTVCRDFQWLKSLGYDRCPTCHGMLPGQEGEAFEDGVAEYIAEIDDAEGVEDERDDEETAATALVNR